jgi:molybdenum cofactor biosynthesis enzyme
MYVSKIIGIITINQTNLVYPLIHNIFNTAVKINMMINFKRDVSYSPWNKSIVI